MSDVLCACLCEFMCTSWGQVSSEVKRTTTPRAVNTLSLPLSTAPAPSLHFLSSLHLNFNKSVTTWSPWTFPMSLLIITGYFRPMRWENLIFTTGTQNVTQSMKNSPLQKGFILFSMFP